MAPSDDAEIWLIREPIGELERVKDRIIEFLERRLSGSTLSQWIGDTKETYYKIVAAWEHLNYKDSQAAWSMLEGAKGYLARSLSELRTIQDPEADRLRSDWESTFRAISEAMNRHITPPPTPSTSTPLIQRASVFEFKLLCFTCHQEAVSWKIAYDSFQKREALQYSGITIGTTRPIEAAEPIFRWLEKEDLPQIDAYVRTNLKMAEGMDAYCPPCRRIYCRIHYQVEETYDDGFYDCSYGTCPDGHRRIIDD